MYYHSFIDTNKFIINNRVYSAPGTILNVNHIFTDCQLSNPCNNHIR